MTGKTGRVEGKKALITGAAGGLGEAFAWMLVREGAKVALTDIDGARVEALAGAINAEIPGSAFAYAHDVAYTTWHAHVGAHAATWHDGGGRARERHGARLWGRERGQQHGQQHGRVGRCGQL